MSAAPNFDQPVAAGGYAWWYVDALDEHGRFGLAIIGFLGSVFSPYYARARRRGHADPLNYCALNIGLYLPRRRYWTMTERPSSRVHRSDTQLAIGPSAMLWGGDGLRIDFDEITAPLPARVRGTVRVHPHFAFDRDIALETTGTHRWRPIAPRAHVEVDLQSPPLRWRGTGYFDSNAGSAPLEQAFFSWQWMRAHLARDVTMITYDSLPRSDRATSLDIRIERDRFELGEKPRLRTGLASTAWGLPRAVATETGTQASIVRALESGPFYARSLLGVTLGGRPALAVHETLSLARFAAPWVRALLPFRMPRAMGS